VLTPTIDSASEPAATAPNPTEPMSSTIVEFLEFTAFRPRTYEQAMEAWRSSCPRLTTWEDALIAGLIEVSPGDAGTPSQVRLTTAGLSALRTARRDRALRKSKQAQQKGKI
jgi:hypothetical protein